MRAVFGASGGGALIYASANMPIMDATAIGLLYVVFVIPLGVLVLKERLNRQHLGAIATCCAGATIVMASRGAFTEFHLAYVFPAGIAVLGAALLAVEGLMIKIAFALRSRDDGATLCQHVRYPVDGCPRCYAVGAALSRRRNVLCPTRTACGDGIILHRSGLSSCVTVDRWPGRLYMVDLCRSNRLSVFWRTADIGCRSRVSDYHRRRHHARVHQTAVQRVGKHVAGVKHARNPIPGGGKQSCD